MTKDVLVSNVVLVVKTQRTVRTLISKTLKGAPAGTLKTKGTLQEPCAGSRGKKNSAPAPPGRGCGGSPTAPPVVVFSLP